MLKRKTFYLWSYVMIGLACVVLYKTSRAPFVDQSKQDHRYQEQVMGTMASVIIWGEDSQEHAIEVMNILKSVDRALSTYKPESEVSRLNRSQGAEFKCSDFLWDNLVASKRAWVLSKGAFDPSIRPLMKVWNFREKRLKLPVQEVIDRAKALIGFEKIQLNDKTKTVMLPAGMKLDFGAIGKGYAVDLAMNYLKQQGVQRALIDLGGNMACLGTPPPEHKSYRLGVRHPVKEKGVMAEVKLLDQAIATSGNYHQYHIIDGQRYAHIIDPRTGWPVQKMDSVTIVSPSATLCDALSTAIYVAGPSLLPEIEKHYPDVHVLIVQVQQDGSLKKWSLGALFTEVAE